MKDFTITHIGDTALSLPMPFKFIPAKGKTFMFQADDSSNLGTKSEGIPITFEKDFWMCAYQTTQEFWSCVVIAAEHKSLKAFPSYFKGETRPVERVNWSNVRIFNDALNSLLHLQKISFENNNRINGKFDLPSETQWEYAAEANQGFVFAGSQNLNDVGWYDRNSNKQTMPVGLKLANKSGLYDMSGNVWEWCIDDFNPNLNDIPKNGSPHLGEINLKTFRGGSCFGRANYCCNRSRSAIQPELKGEGYGFRILFSE
ncbi:formylglycine-generating enzyme family protein [Lacihabitans sp. LS3-19]|uniref:formylglycine-generating enzyme family protein n=1 Tax=Lacihabitans sp. LS3-19 TaxID=2487335 RepID=UPI0020CF6038|nr:formylglycine-generating enzyme family protein [Lacihabitans sp. LS3-19]MCP9766288.1 formylglycine-generating enzyme family protein [Lacihabitans sp. LS3-19]